MSLTAGLTAFYMFRLYYRIFWNKPSHHEHTPHEAPRSMTIPLMFLAVVTLLVGPIPFGRFVSSDRTDYIIHLDWTVAGISVAIALIAIWIATRLYRKESAIPDRLATSFKRLYTAAYKRFYLDEVYLFITKKVIFNGISKPLAWFDRHVVDGTMNGFATISQRVSYAIRGLQSGQLQQYVMVILLGTLLITALVLFI
jgi:NADH-quinone oxidoreductase subunit L